MKFLKFLKVLLKFIQFLVIKNLVFISFALQVMDDIEFAYRARKRIKEVKRKARPGK